MHRVPYRDRPLCFFDIETTGLQAGYHEITEIAFIHERLGSLCMRIMPMHFDRAQEEALTISRFKPEDWAGEPHLDKALPTIVKYLEDTIPVGHNVMGFDLPFLRGDIRAKGFIDEFVPRASIDTQVLATSHLIKHGLNGVSLKACCAHFGISNEGEHSAYDDTLRTKMVYEAIMNCLKWIGREPQQDLF
jgi:DNA polymerase-3 subunit epsilon